MKLYYAESHYLNERYHLFAESEDEVREMLVNHFKEMEYFEAEDIEINIVDYHEIKKGLIRFYSP